MLDRISLSLLTSLVTGLQGFHAGVGVVTMVTGETNDVMNVTSPIDIKWLQRFCRGSSSSWGQQVDGVTLRGVLCRQLFQQDAPVVPTVTEEESDEDRECRNDSRRFVEEWAIKLTPEEERYLSSLLGERHRSKFADKVLFFPTSGFRVRKEYRRLSDIERQELHEAINKLYQSGRYLTFAKLHRARTIRRIHKGPNFMGWHRVFITLFEEALRQVNPRVTVPYWDSSLDNELKSPNHSIIWSAEFLGTGVGPVSSGPFAGWFGVGAYQRRHRLNRNIGSIGGLYSRKFFEDMVSRCHNREISQPWAAYRYNLEKHHDDVHNWVGGDMFYLELAPFDPVFYLHHAYVDYLWEQFRQSQARNCDVDSTQDYPLHSCQPPDIPMDRFWKMDNIDGYADFWTSHWFNYEQSPTCTSEHPTCNSPYLTCDLVRFLCIPITRKYPEEGLKYSGPDVIPELDRLTGTRFRK